jgi:hypothetical protein
MWPTNPLFWKVRFFKGCTMLRRAWHLFGLAVRETGQALDRVGCRLQDKHIFEEKREKVFKFSDSIILLCFEKSLPPLLCAEIHRTFFFPLLNTLQSADTDNL